MDWPRHKARCAKRPSAGPNKEPQRTKADRDHDAKVRADEQAMAMESLRSEDSNGFNQLATDHLATYLSDENPTPWAIKALAVNDLRERVASGQLSSGFALHLYRARSMYLSDEGVTGEERLMDRYRVIFYISVFVRNEPSWKREYAASRALFSRLMAGEVPGCRELVLRLLRSHERTPASS